VWQPSYFRKTYNSKRPSSFFISIIKHFTTRQTLKQQNINLLSRWYLTRLIRPWRLMRYIPSKRRLTYSRLHDVISQKTVLFITTAVRTSNPTSAFILLLLLLLYWG
jgi:hypothetical protein